MLVMLNYVDYMKEPIQKINNGEKEVNVKYHIGAGYQWAMGKIAEWEDYVILHK